MAVDDLLIAIQVSPDAPMVEGTSTATSMVIPPGRTVDRLRHFPEDVYDLSAESNLVRFLKVLLGDAGANQVRKAALIARFRATLQGSHFFDLDRFYGPLFGIQRAESEVLPFDPAVNTATTTEWDDIQSADASFRSRIEQLARALSYGPTPTGMELIAEALLSIDCDVYESFVQADGSYRTVQEMEDLYGDGTPGGLLSDIEDLVISALEGEELSRISGDDRRIFTIRPKRTIDQREAYDLRRVINRVKPADARCVIDFVGTPTYAEVPIDSDAADSEHWEIISEVVSGDEVNSPYPISSNDPVEQPRPPFSGYQGEAWSYNADVIGVNAASVAADGTITVLPVQRIVYGNGSAKNFSADLAILPRSMVQSGRAVSDAVLVTHPYYGLAAAPSLFQEFLPTDPNYGLAPLYVDGMPVEQLVELLQTENRFNPFQQDPQNRYWVGDRRLAGDGSEEVLEVRLSNPRLINYLTFEVSHFPHLVVAEVYTEGDGWVEVYRHETLDSFPRVLPQGVDVTQHQGHPDHASAAHWVRIGTRIDPSLGSRVRLRLLRNSLAVQPPVNVLHDEGGRRYETETAYTLAVRSLDLGYRINSRADFGPDVTDDGVISSTRDINGSAIRFRAHELLAADLLGDGYWRCEPQPVNYAAVSLYLDTRDTGDGRVIDRFYLDPTHVGCHLTIYFSNDPQDVDAFVGDPDDFYTQRTWTPIPRDYVVHQGYVHLPTTRARYWKFEFTNLAAEPYESFVPITRTVRLFPRRLVEEMNRNYQRTATEIPNEMLPALAAVTENLYNDALNAMGVATNPYAPTPDSTAYKATEALYFPNVAQAARAKDASWVLGFTPWQQGDRAPRFSAKGVHTYDQTQVVHTAKVAFFVGLKAIRAYRTQWEIDDDTEVYYDTFDDFRNLTPGFTWEFDPGYLTTGAIPVGECEVVSRSFASRSNVVAVQFATVQSLPIQLVPDHNFRDPALTTYTWDDTDYWTRVGDSQLIYSPSDHAVINIRRVVPQGVATDDLAGMAMPEIHPVFQTRSFEDLTGEIGGLSTPAVGLSAEGKVYAAVRFLPLTDLTSPLLLQIVDDADDTVLVSKAVSGQRNQTVEDWVTYDITGPDLGIRAQLVQVGPSNDAWKVLDLAVFEDSIVWEFSNNGGGDWYPAQTVRNNDRGVLTFPEPGNALCYRARSARARQWISAIKIRPWYVGRKNARTNGTHRGPNVSVYDSDVPIQDDPMFTSWRKPVPAWWFERRQSFPILPVDGTPNVTEFARFYGRPVADTVDTPTDVATAVVIHCRSAEERLDYFEPVTDVATRQGTFNRDGAETIAEPGESAFGQPVYGISKPIVGGMVVPVYSEDRDA